MKTISLLILLAATPITMQAQSAYNASRITLYSGLTFDLISTEAALRTGARETNPILGQNPYRRVGIATGITVATDLWTRRLKLDGHPKLATVVNAVAGGIHFSAGAWNIHVMPRIKTNQRLVE